MGHRISPYVFFLNALHYKGYLELEYNVRPDDRKVLLCLNHHFGHRRLTRNLPEEYREAFSHKTIYNIAFVANMSDEEYEVWKEDIDFFKTQLALSDNMWVFDIMNDVLQNFSTISKTTVIDQFRRLLNKNLFSNRKDSDVYGLLDIASKSIKTQIALLDLHEGDTLYNPLGGYAYATSALSPTINYEGYTSNDFNYIFGKIYMRCMRESSRNQWSHSPASSPSKRQHDHILLNFGPELSNINRHPLMNMTHSESIGIDNPMIREMTDILSDKGRMTFIVPKSEVCKKRSDTLSYLIDNDLLDSITEIYGYTILLINKNKQKSGQVRCIPQHALNINFHQTQIHYSKTFEIDIHDIINADYTLDMHRFHQDYVVRHTPHGYRAVKLDQLLFPITPGNINENGLRPTIYDCHKHNPIQKQNYPFDYVLTTKEIYQSFIRNNSRWSNFYLLKDYCRVLDKDIMLVSYRQDSDPSNQHTVLSPLVPYWFSAKEGNLGYVGTALFCGLKSSDKIDIAYLILQMNEFYFKQQVLHYIFDPDIDKWFYNLYVYLPECTTAIERQQELVAMAKTKYIKQFSDNIGINLQDIYNGEQTYLPNETLLKEGRYKITGSLGHGGFGRTYTALDLHSSTYRIVAIKEFFSPQLHTRNRRDKTVQIIPEKIQEAENALKKFHNEAKIIESCHSEYIINVYDVFDENHTSYYVMEYIDNINLQDYCQHHTLDEKEALRIIRQLCSALQEIHQKGILHLDIKPQNILLTPTTHDVRLIDFGMSHLQTQEQNGTTFVAQSHIFSAPEMLYRTVDRLSPATDIYSVGATLNYMLHPKQMQQTLASDESMVIPCSDPFVSPAQTSDDGTPFQESKTVPRTIDYAIGRALQIPSEMRPQCVNDFLKILPSTESLEYDI